MWLIVLLLFGNKASRDKTCVSTPLNDWSNIHSNIKRHEVLSFHTNSPKRQRQSPLSQCYRLSKKRRLLETDTL